MWVGFYGRSVWRYFLNEKEVVLIVGQYEANSNNIDHWSGQVVRDRRMPNDNVKPVMIKHKNLSIVKLKLLIAAKEYGYNVTKLAC
jgi:hypothetical protein